MSKRESDAFRKIAGTYAKVVQASKMRNSTLDTIADMESGRTAKTYTNCYGEVDALAAAYNRLAKDNRRVSRCDLAHRKAKQAAADIYNA